LDKGCSEGCSNVSPRVLGGGVLGGVPRVFRGCSKECSGGLDRQNCEGPGRVLRNLGVLLKIHERSFDDYCNRFSGHERRSTDCRGMLESGWPKLGLQHASSNYIKFAQTPHALPN